MAKQHSLSKAGIVAAVISCAVLLNHTDELASNTASAGDFGKQLICVAQDLTGGIVQMPLCTGEATQPAGSDPSSAQGD